MVKIRIFENYDFLNGGFFPLTFIQTRSLVKIIIAHLLRPVDTSSIQRGNLSRQSNAFADGAT